VACGVEMQLAMTKVNEQMAVWDFNPLVMGIGINTGEVVVGNIGSEKRTKYGVVGNQVNLTYRIESYTTGGQVLISDSTYQLAKDKILINGSKEVRPKGIQEVITIYDVAGMKEPYHLQLIQESETAFPLPNPITLLYAPLEGKHVTEIFSQGTLQQLSNKGGEIVAKGAFPVVPPVLTNLKIKLMTTDRQLSDDLYAKVVEKSCAEGSFWICFTAKPPPLETYFHQLYEGLKSA
jgi:adenylate cyclase